MEARKDAGMETEAKGQEVSDADNGGPRMVADGQSVPTELGVSATTEEENPSVAKPSMSYIGLIATAILSTPAQRLNLASIYRDIQERFPYFRSRGQGWKNSVRHNLSLNDCFVKLGRCEDGKGSYWGIHPAHRAGFLRGDFRQHRKAGRSRLQRALQVAGRRSAWTPLSPFTAQYEIGMPPHPGPSVAGLGLYCEHPAWRLLAWGPTEPALAGLGEPYYSLYMRPPLHDWQRPWPGSMDVIYPSTWFTDSPYCFQG